MQLGQLGNQHGEQGNGVDHKMDAVVFGVEAGQYVPEGTETSQKDRDEWSVVDSQRAAGRSRLSQGLVG